MELCCNIQSFPPFNLKLKLHNLTIARTTNQLYKMFKTGWSFSCENFSLQIPPAASYQFFAFF